MNERASSSVSAGPIDAINLDFYDYFGCAALVYGVV